MTLANKPRILFLGTPEFAAITLSELINSGSYEILAVICQPDKPSGRGNKLKKPEAKLIAEDNSIPVLQPKSLKNFNKELEKLGEIDLIVCVAYGKIVPKTVLDVATISAVNIHPSILPRWRGAAPIERALFEGDSETAVCLMQMDEGLDSGPVYYEKRVKIEDDDDFVSLRSRLAEIGSELLLEKLPDILSGKLVAKPQKDNGLTYAEKWEKEDFRINWEEEAEVTLRRIRTCAPDGARTEYAGQLIKIHSAQASTVNATTHKAGSVIQTNKEEIIVATGDGKSISIKEMQFPGKKRMGCRDILSGRKIEIGEMFM